MNNVFLKYGALLVILVLLQVSLFNNINLFGYINPYIYVIFIFVYPINRDKTALLLLSFLLGISIDFLTNDGGIHAFSLVFIALLRLSALKLITRKGNFDIEELTLQKITFSNLIIWIVFLTFIHHLLIFILEQFSFNNFESILSKTTLTTIFSVILIIFGLQLFLKRKSNA